jgi:hypothetical protein
MMMYYDDGSAINSSGALNGGGGGCVYIHIYTCVFEWMRSYYTFVAYMCVCLFVCFFPVVLKKPHGSLKSRR